MTLAYVGRCNFNDPAREQAWNDCFSGPKLKQMLGKPCFLTTRRHRRMSGSGRDYLAFWTLVSFDGLSAAEAETKQAGMECHRPGTVWHRSVGLDRPTELLGISTERSSSDRSWRARKRGSDWRADRPRLATFTERIGKRPFRPGNQASQPMSQMHRRRRDTS